MYKPGKTTWFYTVFLLWKCFLCNPSQLDPVLVIIRREASVHPEQVPYITL